MIPAIINDNLFKLKFQFLHDRVMLEVKSSFSYLHKIERAYFFALKSLVIQLLISFYTTTNDDTPREKHSVRDKAFNDEEL